jgi:hypothetical protein
MTSVGLELEVSTSSLIPLLSKLTYKTKTVRKKYLGSIKGKLCCHVLAKI